MKNSHHFLLICKGGLILTRLVNAMGCSSWRRTAPSPLSQASLSIVKGYEKLGIARTGVVHIACFSFSNAHSAAGVHAKASFLSRVVNGAAIFL